MPKPTLNSQFRLNFSWLSGTILLLYIFSQLVSGLSTARALIHPISILFILISYGLVLFMNNKLKGFTTLLLLLLTNKKVNTPTDLENAQSTVDLLEKSTYIVGFIGFLIGLCALLNHLDTPSMIGPNIAMSLLSVLYCTVFMLVMVIPAKTAILNKRGPEQ